MYEDASQIANDAVGSIRTVASFSAEEKVMQLYEEKCEGPVKAGIKEGLISGIGFGMSNFLLFSVYATTFYAGSQLVKEGKAKFSDVFRVNKPSIAIVFFFPNTSQLSGKILMTFIPLNYPLNFLTRVWFALCRFSLL
jgi:ABC-type bacteriocin/lantibiotic exporter with double-glycine peptidase domain